MEPFELVFATIGLLLGLTITEVLGGFARVLKLKRSVRATVRVGLLTPLLGVFVILDLTTFWIRAWDLRAQFGANYPTLLGVLAVIGVYYLAASLIFPDEPEEWPDFDDWYDQHNRSVIGGLLAANMLALIGQIVLEADTPEPEIASNLGGQIGAGAELLVLCAVIALLLVKARRWNVALLAAAGVLLLIAGFAEVV